jgi:hypothetical protein
LNLDLSGRFASEHVSYITALSVDALVRGR